MRTLSPVALSLLALELLFTVALLAQSITGDLIVNVADPTGTVIAGAKLELTAVETNVKIEGKTDSLGNGLFSQLKPGPYRLEVTAPGFQKATITDIVITLGQRAHVDARLTVGAITEAVNVSAAAETLLNSESAAVPGDH